MSAGSILRALTPLGWLTTAAAVVALGVVLLGGLGFRWDPLNLQHKRLEAARNQARDATAVAAAQAEDWKVAKNEDGIKVSLSEVPGSDYKAYQGVTLMKTTVAKLRALQDDVHLLNGLNVARGAITCGSVAEAHGLPFQSAAGVLEHLS